MPQRYRSTMHYGLAGLMVLLSLGISCISAAQSPAQQAGITTRVSVASDGTQANEGSEGPSLSANGRYVAFASAASNLVPGVPNAVHVFVHDRQTSETDIVSVASDGTPGTQHSYLNSLCADGRYVAFMSYASNLVLGDTNDRGDIFVHDRQTGQTTLVSVASDGTQGSQNSYWPSLSDDGRYVAFMSYASNLVPGDTNGWNDIFVHDRQTGETTRVSVASDGTQGNQSSHMPSLSAHGRYVAFMSYATTLVSDDIGDLGDVFVHDRQTGQTTRVSIASDGTQGNGDSEQPAITADGRYVGFYSKASNLVQGDTNEGHDVFVHDRQMGQTTRVSLASGRVQGNQSSIDFSLSADGRYVAFLSYASNLVPGDTNNTGDVFVHDRQTGQTTRVSIASDGTQGNDQSRYPSICADGRYVGFYSMANTLVPGDINRASDIFVHDRGEAFAVDPFIWQVEAEDKPAVAVRPLMVGEDAAASGCLYVYCSESWSAGAVVHRFKVPSAGDYYLWARAMGLGWQQNRLLVSVDWGPDMQDIVPKVDEQWTWGWQRVDGGALWLSAAEHTLRFRWRDPNIPLDHILLTDSATYVPVPPQPCADSASSLANQGPMPARGLARGPTAAWQLMFRTRALDEKPLSP